MQNSQAWIRCKRARIHIAASVNYCGTLNKAGDALLRYQVRSWLIVSWRCNSAEYATFSSLPPLSLSLIAFSLFARSGLTSQSRWSTTRWQSAAPGRIWLKRADEPTGYSRIRPSEYAEWRTSCRCTGFWWCSSNGYHPYSATLSSVCAAGSKGRERARNLSRNSASSWIYRRGFANVSATFRSPAEDFQRGHFDRRR